jgi:hypothetical protein
MVSSVAAPLIVYGFRSVRRSKSTEGTKFGKAAVGSLGHGFSV